MGPRCFSQLCPLAVALWASLYYCSASSQAIEHTFEILHENTSKCLSVDSDRLTVDQCSTSNKTLWTWGSNHRLFSPDSQKCLGLDLSKPQDALKLVPCDSRLHLFWHCRGGHIYGASTYLLGVKTGSVTASLDFSDTWRAKDTSQNICDIPYHVVYTTGGNSYGKACEFPFLKEGTWYHDCIYKASEDREWCATSGDFDSDRIWGNCLKPVVGCNDSWTQNSDLRQCYQLNALSSLKWKEAYMSCRSQGADLLSITSPEELKYITEMEDLPNSVWIGLNRLEAGAGWQWSDKSPLNFVNWDQGFTTFTVLDGTSCGALNVNSSQWEPFSCDASLPYICKKRVNGSEPDSPDYWHYSETECSGNWTAYNGYCYMLQQPGSWGGANESCAKDNASLISLHSLADIELVVTKFQSDTDNIWSGFQSQSVPALFQWSDGSGVHYTYWDKNEPLPPFNVTPSCVSFSGQTGRWHVRNCDQNFTSICQKPAERKNDTKPDSGCPQDKPWRRHGQYCYLVNKTEVSFETRCNLTITNKFEQEFLNTLMREHGGYFWTNLRDSDKNGDYYWETADGRKDFPYSNWNTHEPTIPGGCVVVSAGESLGKWEVKDCKTFKARSICKQSIGSEKEKEVSKANATTCPAGWTAGSEQYCYKLFHRERLLKKRTWEEAEGICEEFGGHLVSFAHIQEMKDLIVFLKSIVSETRWFWVGLNKRNLGGWEWSDNRPISSTVLDDVQDEDYILRDCAALEINLPKRNVWMWHVDQIQQREFLLKPFHCDAQLEWVCQVPKGELLKSPEWYQPEWGRKAGPPLETAGSKYWFVSDPRLTFKEAELYCASNGNELAAMDFFTSKIEIMKSIPEHAVLAGHSRYSGLTERWWIKSMDYGHFNYDMFYRVLHPSFKDCPYIVPISYSPGSSTPVNCNERLPFICSNHNSSLLEIVSYKLNGSSGSCPGNWTSYGNKCFLKVPYRYMTFKSASEYCHVYGGTLPTISSQQEQDYITYLSSGLMQKFWIGLRLGMNAPKNNWLDGSSITYTYFHPILQGRLKRFQLDPRDSEKNQQCVFFLNDPKSSFIGTWDFTSCADMQYVSICQKNRDHNGTLPSSSVPDDLEYQGKKYKIISKNVTWFGALSECQSHNMELVSAVEQYELSFLTVTVSQVGRPLWIGLSSRDDGIHYRWQDGSPVTVTRWSKDYLDEGDCVFMALDGTWRAENCGIELPGAVCHTPTIKREKKPENTVACPHRVGDTIWTPFQNSCYAFLLSHTRWKPSLCRTLHPDSYALNIRSEEENRFIFGHLQPYIDLASWVWLGVIYDGNGDNLRWHDESFVQYSNWREGRPQVSNNSFYAAMHLDGFWDFFSNPKTFQLGLLQQHSIVACKIEMDSTEKYMTPLPTVIPYFNFTYNVLKKRLTWYEAVRQCKESDGHLASIHDESQQLLLEHIVRQDGFPVWIGLWNNDGTGSNPEWSDGTTFNYAPPNLEKMTRPESCTFLDTKGTWRPKNCTEFLDGAICYKSPAMQSKAYSKDQLCSNTPGSGHWIRQKDFCYGFDMKLYNYSVFTSEQANRLCETLDPTSTLLTINDQEENEFVSKYIKSDALITSRVWLGVGSNLKDESVWLNGSPIQYSNWSTVKGTSGACAILHAESGTWHKVPCAPGQGRVVCKMSLKSSGAGVAIGISVFIILLLITGLFFYLCYKKPNHFFSSSVRYRRAEENVDSFT